MILDPNCTKYLALLVVFVGAVIDFRTRRLPNLLTGPAALLGLAISFCLGGWGRFALAIGGALLGVALIELPQIITRKKYNKPMGGGDTKLFGALGAILLPSGILIVTLYFCLIYGMFGIYALVQRRRNPGSKPSTVALGPFIAAATVLAMLLESATRQFLGMPPA